MSFTLDNWFYLSMCFLHDLALAVYVGGAIAMEFILNPAQATIPPAQAQILGQKTSDRFLLLVWISLALLLITGLVRLHLRGFFGWDPVWNWAISWDYAYGRTMYLMLIIWALLVINGGLITFWLRPTLTRKIAPGSSQAEVTKDRDAKMSAAVWIQNLTRADLVLALLAMLLGASLIRGGAV